MSDGAQRFMNVSGEPVFDAAGAFAGYRGVGRDVTTRMRAEQMLKLEHRVAASLAGTDDVSAGLQGVMRAVCESEGCCLPPLSAGASKIPSPRALPVSQPSALELCGVERAGTCSGSSPQAASCGTS